MNDTQQHAAQTVADVAQAAMLAISRARNKVYDLMDSGLLHEQLAQLDRALMDAGCKFLEKTVRGAIR